MGGRRRKSGKWDYQGGWNLKVKGMGSLWEAGEERVGSGITRVAGN